MFPSDINLQSHCISRELPKGLLEALHTFLQRAPSPKVPTCLSAHTPYIHPNVNSENVLLLPAVLPLLTALVLPDLLLSSSSA